MNQAHFDTAQAARTKTAPGKRPFIYIASLRRTGSTVTSEALTSLPKCYIFLEPCLGQGQFKFREENIGYFRERGIDLSAFQGRYANRDGRVLLRAFRDELMPQLQQHVAQIGVKEIMHQNWRLYLEVFPDMKIVLTGRDPRDVYISIHDRAKQGLGRFTDNLSPEVVAEDLNRHFQHQWEMAQAQNCLPVRYEDLCTDPVSFANVKAFVESDIPEIGEIGQFNSANAKRVGEFELHGGRITDRRVRRWQSIGDARLQAEADRVFELMPKYCDFWGYPKAA